MALPAVARPTVVESGTLRIKEASDGLSRVIQAQEISVQLRDVRPARQAKTAGQAGR